MKREAEFENPESVDKVPKTMANKDGSADEITQFISPTIERPNQQAQRYDRQLRLWQDIGQKRLANSSIALWDSGATSCQIAKNLTLAGVCRLNIFDTTKVRQSDVGNNFFLDPSSLGKPRVEACHKLLAELNRSSFIDPNDYNELEGGFDYDFEDSMMSHELDVLIGVRLSSDEESTIEDICHRNNVPAILVQTCGLVAQIQVAIRERGIIETHSESLVDLRLDCPFPAMAEFAKSFQMDKMDNHEHAHIPAVVIIIQFLERFKSEHDGKLPQDSTQREELKKMILAEKRSIDEDNFDEAIGMIWKACQPTKVPAHIEMLFNDKHCAKIPKFDTEFWFLVKCLREFVKENPMHQLPLSGVLPDMKSDTKNYVKMQSIYRHKAQEDLESYRLIVKKTKESWDKEVDKKEKNKDEDGAEKENENGNNEKDADKEDEDKDEEEEEEEKEEKDEDEEDEDHDARSYYIERIPNEMIETFVKNSAHLRLIRPRWSGDVQGRLLMESDPENEDYTATWYFAFSALQSFRDRHRGRYPGVSAGKEEKDFEQLCEIALESLGDKFDKSKGVPTKLSNALKEMVRAGGSELPHISSLVGGMVAQEVIKLLTQQYIPLNGYCIFDGYRSATGVIN